MKKGYTKTQCFEMTGLTLREIQFYTESGVVIPGVDAAGGRGKHRRYSRENLVEFLIVKELHRYKIAVSVMKNIFSNMRELNLMQWFDPNGKWVKTAITRLYLFEGGESEGNITYAWGVDEPPLKFENRKSVLVLNINELVKTL